MPHGVAHHNGPWRAVGFFHARVSWLRFLAAFPGCVSRLRRVAGGLPRVGLPAGDARAWRAALNCVEQRRRRRRTTRSAWPWPARFSRRASPRWPRWRPMPAGVEPRLTIAPMAFEATGCAGPLELVAVLAVTRHVLGIGHAIAKSCATRPSTTHACTTRPSTTPTAAHVPIDDAHCQAPQATAAQLCSLVS